jgi:SEFIR domain/TIR domain
VPNPLPKVFISYSHDSADHEELVLSFAERLRSDGVDAQIDQYVRGTPTEGWPRWMLNKLEWADFALLVCTDTYYRRFRGKDEPDHGRGADFEGQLVTLEIYRSKSRAVRFIPILFSPEDEKNIPEPLTGQSHYLLEPGEDESVANYAKLYALLTGHAGVTPRPLGPLITLARKEVSPIKFGDLTGDSPSYTDAHVSPRIPDNLHFHLRIKRSIFICFDPANADSGAALTAALERSGCTVAHSRTTLSERFSPRMLGSSIADAQVFVLLWSAAALGSENVQLECETALALRVPIVLCRLDDTSLQHPFTDKQGIKPQELPSSLENILDSLPEAIEQPPVSVAQAVLRHMPESAGREPEIVVEKIRQKFAKKRLLSVPSKPSPFGSVYVPDPNVKTSPRLSKQILVGLWGVLGACIVAALGWLSDPKNVSTTVAAALNVQQTVVALFHGESHPSDTHYTKSWKEELLGRRAGSGGFRVFSDPSSATQAWTSSQCLAGLLSDNELVAPNAKDLAGCFDFLESARTTDKQGGWGMWERSVFPITEITAWIILAEVHSMKEEVADDIWSQEQQSTVNNRIMRDLDCNRKVQDPSGGWLPIEGVPTSEVRTYSTAMALWSELAAVTTPRVRRFIGDRYKESISKALFWFESNARPDLGGWVPKPSRYHQDHRYPALTAQIICILSLAEHQPEFASIKNWVVLKKVKQEFVSRLDPKTDSLSSIPNDQVETQDQAVPPAIELEGSTFLAFPWTLMACETLKTDSALAPADQKRAALAASHLWALLPKFNDHLLDGTTETYEIAESLAAIKFLRSSL